MTLKNKLAVITGVSSGIGLATTNALLSLEATVIGWGRTRPDITHENFHFYPTDITSFDAVASAYAETTKAHGSTIDILINNAGMGVFAPMEETSNDDWHRMFDTNVHGLFYCSKLIIPGMKKNKSGYIINIASIAATMASPNLSGYCGTKYAVRGISHSMYKELRYDGIKVSAIYPGSVKTKFFDKIDAIEASDNMMMPEDIAGTIVHLLGTSPNYHTVDVEVRPLMPKGKPQ